MMIKLFRSIAKIGTLHNANQKVLVRFYQYENSLNTTATAAEPEHISYKHQSFHNALKSEPLETAQDWTVARQEIIECNRYINDTNFNAMVLQYCIQTRDYSLAETCLKFIKTEQETLNLAVMGRLLQLYYSMQVSKVFSGNYIDTINKLYEDIRSRYKLLDAGTLEHLIIAYSITSEWQLCIKLLEEAKISCNPTHNSWNFASVCAFRNGQYAVGWDLVNLLSSKKRIPFTNTYIAMLENTSNRKAAMKTLLDMFQYFNNFDVVGDVELITQIEDVCSKYDIRFDRTEVDRTGKCNCCKRTLPRVELKTSEFNDLKTAFMDQVIIGNNVFSKTTPTELDNFKKFIKEMTSFDVVIDGLNVAYSTGNKTNVALASTLATVVDHYAAMKKRILVIGREHMHRWPKRELNFIKHSAVLFLTQNVSHDDPFIIYCALHSGAKTQLVSKDFMRSHIALLKSDQHRRLFKRWLAQNRTEIAVIRGGNVYFNKSLPYLQIAQDHASGWHIPFRFPNDDNFNIRNWLCLRFR